MPVAPSFSQLWVEESEELFRLGRAVRDGGAIVDVGTAQGGSACIFHEATRGHGVAIHTFDPRPSREAYTNLAGTGVVIAAHASVIGAREWHGPAVDLLFIDGSHHLVDVVQDFNAWSAHLSPGATVAFHDYDAEERGGLIHLGVRIALDALLAKRLLTDPARAGRILSGTVRPGSIEAKDCLDTVRAFLARVVSVLGGSYAGWFVLGEAGHIADLLDATMDLSGAHRVETVEHLDSGARVLVCQRPLGDTMLKVRARRPSPARVELLDNLLLCYLLERALANDRSRVLELTRNRKAFFKWEEVLDTLDHATAGHGQVSHRLARLPAHSTLDGISAFVALEQVRLVCLARMFHAITDYEL